ncbi:MAG: SDR family NAD(P)-dependent oxidoreductase, partial [Terracidiphilus sp.]
MRGVKGKVAIVTGASSGIGQGIAKRLGSEGAKVIVDYVGTPEGAEETERAIKEAGSDGEIVQADVTKMGDVQKLVDVAWQRFGTADILVNNAG